MKNMNLKQVKRVLENHGLTTKIMGEKIFLYDNGGKSYDTVELVEGYEHTTIKTCEYDSIRLLYWLGY